MREDVIDRDFTFNEDNWYNEILERKSNVTREEINNLRRRISDSEFLRIFDGFDESTQRNIVVINQLTESERKTVSRINAGHLPGVHNFINDIHIATPIINSLK